MSDITRAARNLLLLNADVQAITEQVYLDHLPQTIKPPAIALWTVSGTAENFLQGFTGFEQVTIQIDSYALTRQGARALWKAVNQTFDGYRGITLGVEIRAVAQASGSYDREDRPETGTDKYRYVTTQDFEFSYHVYERAC